jgi:16S rRNA (uracil1498-N3)-methyltransferase
VLPRLYVPFARPDNEVSALGADEQHYARHVLRLRAGDPVRVFDGAGHEWHAVVGDLAGKDVTIALGDPVPPAPEPPVPVTLALAVLKSDYMDDAVRNAAMLGVTRIQPLLTVRSAGGRGVPRTAAVERWRRVALASVRQCGRAVVPDVAEPKPLDAWLAEVAAGVRLLLCEPRLDAAERLDLNGLRARAQEGGVTLLVGPEGGWDEGELAAAARRDFHRWTVSRRVLRADAAAVAALAVLFYAWDAAGV